MHVPKEQRSKLESKDQFIHFCWYRYEEYDFKFYDLKKKQVVRSRDGVLFEHEMGAYLLSERYRSTSKSYATTDDPICVHQPTSENIETLDDVGEVQLNDNGDASEYNDGDFGTPKVENVHSEFILVIDGGEP